MPASSFSTSPTPAEAPAAPPDAAETPNAAAAETPVVPVSSGGDLLDQISEGLRQKASAKQEIWRNVQAIFEELRVVSQELVSELARRMTPVDTHVVLEYRAVSEFEFQVRFSGDLLVFVLHSNIVTFPEDHPLLLSDYVQQDFRRRFFGHIMAYNFMADAIRYARMQDAGYLMGRMLVNIENKVFLEGAQELNIPVGDRQAVEPLEAGHAALRQFVESAMIAAVNNDLLAPDLDAIRTLTVKQKLENQQLREPPRKVGFTFGHERSGFEG